MSGVSAATAPSLSQIVSWDIQHLEDAARGWSATARQWENSFSSVYRESLTPGGSAWDGEAAHAAQERTYRDLLRVRGLADMLHEAGSIAQRGADELAYAKRRALQAVRDAESSGFVVGQDLSVASRKHDANPAAQAQRFALAKLHAAKITARATELSTLDNQVATSSPAAPRL
jgi:hypothetical protein